MACCLCGTQFILVDWDILQQREFSGMTGIFNTGDGPLIMCQRAAEFCAVRMLVSCLRLAELEDYRIKHSAMQHGLVVFSGFIRSEQAEYIAVLDIGAVPFKLRRAAQSSGQYEVNYSVNHLSFLSLSPPSLRGGYVFIT